MVELMVCRKPLLDVFQNGSRILVSECVDGVWTHSGETCISAADEEFFTPECNRTALKPPEGSIVNPSLDEPFAVLYSCTDKMNWLSGKTFSGLTQCINGIWTPISDACAEECTDVIRDCSHIARYINESGVYMVFPDGKRDSPGVEVWCYLEDSEHPGGSGWTVLMRAVAGNIVFPNLPASSYSEAINDPSNDNYFLGFNTLLKMNWNNSATRRPLVLQILLSADDGYEYHITYDNFVIDNDFSLLSVGESLGTAWNQLGEHIGYPFWKPDGKSAWWTPLDPALADDVFHNQSWLTDAAPRWKLWDALKINSVKLRFRPLSYDNEVNCPIHVDLFGKYYNRPIERLPGIHIEFSCWRDMHYMAGPGNTLYTTGIMECLWNGGYPIWNETLNVPCKFTCPDFFMATYDERYCYNFTKLAQPNFGFVSGALTCAKLNASLAIVGDMAYLDDAETGVTYFSAHNYRGGNNIIGPLPTLLTCNDVCEATGTEECLSLSKGGYYDFQSCKDSSTQVICEYPGRCPSPYVEHRGLCYRVVDTGVSDLLSTQAVCNQDGASLAYPEDMDTLKFIAGLVETTLDPASTEIIAAIGLNEALGDWTFNGLYTPSDDVIEMAGISPSPAQLWRLLVIPLPSPSQLDLIPASLESNDGTIAICQLYGPISCFTSPPEPTVNMTMIWNGESDMALYECLPGYFVEGNISVTQQNITCIGGLGEWHPQMKNCLASEVCLEPLSDASKTLENSTDSNLRFLNGTGIFFCPESMATVEGNTTQTITCSSTGSGYAFDPPTILPCNVCISEPLADNSEVQWTNATVWTVGAVVTADCFPGHMLNISSNTQHSLCTETGWEVKEGCYPACENAPPEVAPGSNVVQSDFVSNNVGAVLVYNCLDGYFIPPTELGKMPENQTSVTCMQNNTWVPADIPSCSKLCLDDPVSVSPPTNSSWNGIDREIGTEVVLSCPNEHYFPDMNQTLIITCGEDGLWTAYSSDSVQCRIPAPGVPPQAPEGTVLEQNQTNFFVGDFLNFTCEPPQMSASGTTYVTVQSTNEGWTELDPSFVCHNVCLGAPPTPPEGVTSNYTGVPIWGTWVNYVCQGTFIGHPVDSFLVTCESGTWSHSKLPFCGKSQSLSPSLSPLLSP
ncbi:uncharacterized protein [Palaemon carinicauda]|uniref:uncharacterized protein n=1 Tax=Palaemon carinicauda TaxID=392227 RepID=UPI0035B5C243